MLKVKSKKEAQQALKAATVQKPAVSASQPQNSSGIEIVKDSGGVVANEVVIAAKSDGKININTATIKELDSLSGIGESIAQDIIDYREKNGGFKSINDIMKVAGIKEKTFNKIKDRITVK
ncbi:MAG: helix-hairpin-helix domain-containing protein [Clostridia bacterium]|nr:helix-hairpin-helix domain-containing protein [Clostridia bacterium]